MRIGGTCYPKDVAAKRARYRLTRIVSSCPLPRSGRLNSCHLVLLSHTQVLFSFSQPSATYTPHSTTGTAHYNYGLPAGGDRQYYVYNTLGTVRATK